MFSRRKKYWYKEAQGLDKNPTIRIPVAWSERNICNCQLKNYVRHWGRFYRLNGLLLTGSLCGTKKHQQVCIHKSYYTPPNEYLEMLKCLRECNKCTLGNATKENMRTHDNSRKKIAFGTRTCTQTHTPNIMRKCHYFKIFSSHETDKNSKFVWI